MGSSNIEIEAKVLLLKEEYNKVIEVLNLNKYRKFCQTNYYIDTKDSYLKKNGIALRIREKDDVFELILKTPLSEGLLEKNEDITWKQMDDMRDSGIFPEGGIIKFLLILGVKIEDLQILTSLTTERISVDYNGYRLDLDKNTYGGITDYELEVESTSMEHARGYIKDILEQCGINDFSFNKVSKQARALNALNK
jgi:uncharacterized protein YjbK